MRVSVPRHSPWGHFWWSRVWERQQWDPGWWSPSHRRSYSSHSCCNASRASRCACSQLLFYHRWMYVNKTSFWPLMLHCCGSLTCGPPEWDLKIWLRRFQRGTATVCSSTLIPGILLYKSHRRQGNDSRSPAEKTRKRLWETCGAIANKYYM